MLVQVAYACSTVVVTYKALDEGVVAQVHTRLETVDDVFANDSGRTKTGDKPAVVEDVVSALTSPVGLAVGWDRAVGVG